MNFFQDYIDYFIDFDSMSDSEIGKYFLEKYVEVYNSQYTRPPLRDLTLDEFLVKSAGSEPNGRIFLDGYGGALRSADISTSHVLDSYDRIFEKYQNTIPNRNVFFSAITSVVIPSPIEEKALDVVSKAYEETKTVVSDVYDKSKQLIGSAANASNGLFNQIGSFGTILLALVLVVVGLSYFKGKK